MQFVDTNFELGNNYIDVIAQQDVAVYGGLCALASFDRAELKVCVFHFPVPSLPGELVSPSLKGS
jgi:hypothetical protein